MMDASLQKVQAAFASLTRRPLAVLAADVVDYSRLSEAAEAETHVRLRALRVDTIDPCVVSYRGQIIKNTGDGFLATFDSCVDAIRCSLEMQRDIDANTLHISSYLSGQGQRDYPNLLRAALESGTDDTLAEALGQMRRLERAAPRRSESEGFNLVAVPANAAQVSAYFDPMYSVPPPPID